MSCPTKVVNMQDFDYEKYVLSTLQNKNMENIKGQRQNIEPVQDNVMRDVLK